MSNLTLVMFVLQKDIEENGESKSTVIPYWRCQPYIRSVHAIACSHWGVG